MAVKNSGFRFSSFAYVRICSEQDTASEYENSKISFISFGHLVGGLHFPKPSREQIMRFFIMASISFSQRRQAVGKKDVFVFAVFDNCGFMKKLLFAC